MPTPEHLEKQLEQARAMALKMMAASSEIGLTLQFVKHSFQVESIAELARQLLEFIGNSGLIGSILILSSESHEFFTLNDDNLINESQLLKHLDFGRIIELNDGLIINYPHSALLVENIPKDDVKVGELRDNLAILMDAVEARVWSLLLQRQADDARRLKDAFIELISHELRTPLNPIVGYANRLEKRLATKLERRELEALNAIKEHAESLRATVEDMLEMSRVEMGQLSLKPIPSDLGSIASKVLQRAEMVYSNSQGKFGAKIEHDIPVIIDRQRMSDVIWALICNANQHAHNSDLAVRVFRSGTQSACIEVQDSGHGIALNQQRNVFKHFLERKTTSSQTVPSEGISLYLAKAIVEHHKGSIVIESTPGEGALFRITLPCYIDACN